MAALKSLQIFKKHQVVKFISTAGVSVETCYVTTTHCHGCFPLKFENCLKTCFSEQPFLGGNPYNSSFGYIFFSVPYISYTDKYLP